VHSCGETGATGESDRQTRARTFAPTTMIRDDPVSLILRMSSALSGSLAGLGWHGGARFAAGRRISFGAAASPLLRQPNSALGSPPRRIADTLTAE
jgi:hypothetical protein